MSDYILFIKDSLFEQIFLKTDKYILNKELIKKCTLYDFVNKI